jgi:hypothetical protein
MADRIDRAGAANGALSLPERGAGLLRRYFLAP